MSDLEPELEALRRLWRNGPQGKEDVRMAMHVLREKRQSFEKLIREQSKGEYMFGLPFAVITILFAWRATSAPIRLGYGALAVTLIAASAVTWWNARKTGAPPEPDASVKDYHLALVALYDNRIRFLRGVKYWYAIPLLLGGGAVLFPAAIDILPAPWGVLVLSIVLFAAWLGIWHRNDVRGVAEIERKKSQVNELLRQLEQL